jgi:hypothetical protein
MTRSTDRTPEAQTGALSTLRTTVARARDEARLQLHLGTAELKEEFEEMEARWKEVARKQEVVGDTVGETSTQVAAGLRLTLEELRDGYATLQRRLGQAGDA